MNDCARADSIKSVAIELAVGTESSRQLWVKNGRLRCLRSRLEPDRHTRLKTDRILQIQAQAQRIAVVTANRTFGLPGRECAQRAQLSDQSRRFLRCA